MIRTNLLAFVVLILMVSFTPGDANPPSSEGPLTLIVHPYLPYDELMERFTPLARYLGEQLGRNVLLTVSRDYQEHAAQIGRDEVDIAFIGPAGYARMIKTHGRKPLLAHLEVNHELVFKGAIITRMDSAITRLEALQGRRFAFGDPESASSHLVPRYMLLQAGIPLQNLADYKYLGSHTNVALGVMSGDFDAGAVKEEVYREYEARGLRLLAWTPPLPEHLFVAREGMPVETLDTLRNALLELRQTEAGIRILRAIKPGVTGMMRICDADFDGLRHILERLEPVASQ